MKGAARLTPAQLAAAVERDRDGRPDKAVMTADERRAAGLMDLHQAAEHEHLATLLHERLADRRRGPDPDDPWAGADETLAIWRAWAAAGHTDCGSWHQDPGGPLVCACGELIVVPEAS